MEELDRKLVN